MTWGIRIEGWLSSTIGVSGVCRRGLSPDFRRSLAFILAVGLAPLGMWLIGTAIVHIAPPVYQSEAILKLPATTADAAHALASAAVIDEAASTLAPGRSPDPMAKQMLWSNLTLKQGIGSDVVQVTARGHDPIEAQRTLMAVVESYEHHHVGAGSRLLVYAAPLESMPVDVPHGMRLVLGFAGLALIGLLMGIPLLRRLEGVPFMQSGRELLSGIARAFAEVAPPRAGEYLPAAQPAG